MGTVTDFDGFFELTVPAGVKNLVISYVGYKTITTPVKPEVNVTLQSDAEQLEEVVVTGMVKQDKRLFTGAATKLEADETMLSGVADVSRSLEGRAAGVSVQNVSGTFGTAPKIRVRGATSIYGASKPLWVVDGVVLEDAVEMAGELLKEIPGAAQRCADCREQLLQGADLAAALGENGLLSPSACRLLTLGMRSGTGDGIMETIARRMQDEAQEALESAVGKVEPALVLVTSGLVGVILLSVMLPLMNIMTAIG